jgi:hypothetical protein
MVRRYEGGWRLQTTIDGKEIWAGPAPSFAIIRKKIEKRVRKLS